MTGPAANRSWVIAFRAVLIGVVILILLTAILVAWRVRLNNRINARIAVIRSAGYPTSSAEVNAWIPQVADSENGALLLMRAFTNLHEFTGNASVRYDDLFPTHRTNMLTAEQLAFARQYVQTNAEALAQIEAALRYEKFRYPIDYSSGPSTKIPHLKQIKTTAQLLRIRTMLEVQDHSPAWTNSIRMQLKLAESLDAEPGIIGYLVRVAVIRIATTSAERALGATVPDTVACKMLRAAFLETTKTNTLPQALIGERAMWTPYFRLSRAEMESVANLDENDNPRQLVGKGFVPFWAIGIFESDLDFYLSTLEKGIEVSRLPAPTSLQLTNVFDVSRIAHRKFYLFSGALLPALSKLSIKGASAEASAKLAASAFAMEEFRQANNRLPEDLKELAPQLLEAVPIDPFDGKPIRYRKLDHGYVLYSVDADGRDDGGTTAPARRKFKDPTSYDVSFTVDR